MDRVRHGLCCALAGLVLAGCVRHRAFRWPDAIKDREIAQLDEQAQCGFVLPRQPRRSNNESCADRRGVLFDLAYAEIDDQGEAWDDWQITDTLAFLENARAKRPALVVVFVHGWRHDAGASDSNVADFRRVLYGLAMDERRAQTGRAVLGLYVGWRAHPFLGSRKRPQLGTPLTTFSARKKGAHRVGDRDAARIFDALGVRIESWRQQDAKAEQGSRTRALIVGHSFGAALVHSAVHRQLEVSLLRQNATQGDEGRALAYDLVALVNPAFEASRLRQLHALGERTKRPRPAGARPLSPELVVVTTAADCNTAGHFKAAMTFETGKGVVRRHTAQKDQRVTGAGHWAWPGRVLGDAIACSPAPAGAATDGLAQVQFIGDQELDDDATPRPAPEQGIGKRKCRDACRYVEHDNQGVVCRLVRQPEERRVLIVYDTDSALMDHHSDAFTRALWTFLFDIAAEATSATSTQ